ncbi:hypothetical protein C7E12_19190, partial [Stenotrophomonas maltophilia]
GFGGPHAAFMACRDAYKRSMPGRLIGVSIDAQAPGLSPDPADPRAAHPPREATSNICTAQVLRQQPAFRRAIRFRWPARRVHGLP